MKVENPVALRFILEDELYLLNTDKALYEKRAIPEPIVETEASIPEIKTQVDETTVERPVPEIKIPVVEPTVEIPATAVETPVTSFNYQGQNLKNFLILVHYPELEFIAEAHLTALQNILKRKEFELQDVAILNMAKYGATNLDELTGFFKPTKLLILGQQAMPAGISGLVLNTPKPLNGYTALYSFSFGEMMDSVDNKKAFWEQMKTL